MTKSQIKLIIVILFGWIGIHKFMEKNSKMGCIYLLTFGLFGIGWIVDIIKSLLEVLNEKKKSESKSSVSSNTIKTISTNSSQPVKSESEKNYDLFLSCVDNYYLAYEYEEKIAFPETSIISGNGGKKISFEQEPNNEHDNNAVAIYLNDVKIGYLYRGRTQDMVNDWIKKNYFFWGYINKIDVKNNTATFKIGFYKNINNLEMKSFKLTKITKKASEFESSRFENLENCSNGDAVEYEKSYESDNYVITDEYGNELGELGTKAVDWIDENEDYIKFTRINNIEETDSGSYKADIEFFYK